MNDACIPIVFLIIVIIAQAGSSIFFRKTTIVPKLDTPAYIPLPGGKGITTTARKIITTTTASIAFGALVVVAVAVIRASTAVLRGPTLELPPDQRRVDLKAAQTRASLEPQPRRAAALRGCGLRDERAAEAARWSSVATTAVWRRGEVRW